MTSSVSRCFPPVVSEGTQLIILGSLPGEMSLARQQYYGHPKNQFWRLTAQLVGADFSDLDYAARLERLIACGVGLWDVVASAVRPGSLDQHMREITPNALLNLMSSLPHLKAVAFNGAAASRIGRRQIENQVPLTLVDLPSSSPANTLSYEAKAEAWRRLMPFLVV